MSDMKEITARALGIFERLKDYSAIEKAEILTIFQAQVNVELAREARTTQTSKNPLNSMMQHDAKPLDETVQ